MKHTTSFVLILIGVILGFINAIGRIATVSFVNHGMLNEMLWFVTADIGRGFFLYQLGLGLLGLIMSAILIHYLLRVRQRPNQSTFTVITVLGALGIILGMGLVPGVIVLIGGVLGLARKG